MNEDWQTAGFGVYVHWPFCQAKCPYCDFNSHVRDRIDQQRWAAALAREIEAQAQLTPGRRVDTVFFGGGTPSLMAPETVASVLEAIGRHWKLSEGAEITLEANPTSVEADRFQGFAQAGVNRVSIGVQSLIDADLKALGRRHSAAEARAAFDVARKAFGRVSFDMIYGRQHQTLAAWRCELGEALAMAVDHLSLYMLTIEAGTRFGDLYDRGRLSGLPGDELGADLYALTQELCDAAGMPAYEVSNHARRGAESRHNLIYWRYGDYAGVGPGAHGRLTLAGEKVATTTPARPEDWLAQVETGGSACSLSGAMPASEQAVEYAMMALRLREGLSRPRYRSLAGADFSPDVLARLEAMGMITCDADRLAVTDTGRPLLNAVLRELLA